MKNTYTNRKTNTTDRKLRLAFTFFRKDFLNTEPTKIYSHSEALLITDSLNFINVTNTKI